MRIGKVKESILKRSVLKQINQAGKSVDCLRGDFCTQVIPVEGWTLTAPRAVYGAVNAVAAVGAVPSAVSMTILMPEGTEEKQLKALMKEMSLLCGREGVCLIVGHTAVSRAVNTLVLSVTGIGQRVKDGHDTVITGIDSSGKGSHDTVITGIDSSGKGSHDTVITGIDSSGRGSLDTGFTGIDYSGKGHPVTDYSDMDILMVGHAGREGAALLAIEKDEELSRRYARSYIETARHFYDDAGLLEAAKVLSDCGALKMHAVGEGGVFGALWEFASSLNTGVSVDLKKIPIRQHTIEICEYFNLNPYMLLSGGCLLAVCPDGEKAVIELNKLYGSEKTVQRLSQMSGIEHAGKPLSHLSNEENSEKAAQKLSQIQMPDEDSVEEAASGQKSGDLRDLQFAIIGRTTAGNDRLIHYDEEETRYLEPPKMDEIFKERI